jgi:SNF family Na+-dependent transporter
MSRPRDEWNTRLGVILAVAGSAVGLGNFLRFPGQAAQNGGGAFMIPYFCALLFLGIPIGWAEWTMARYAGLKGVHSAPAVLGVAGRGTIARYLGIIGVLIPLTVSFYYTYIEAWCLGYAWQYLTGGIGVDVSASIAQQTATSKEYFDQFVGNGSHGIIYGGSMRTFVFWVLTFATNIWLVHRGISRGIEKFCSWAMPVMAICALLVTIRVLTLGTPDPAYPDRNVVNGLGYMWNPDFRALGNAQTWLAAAGQIFFSLSVGFGVILNYASYLKKTDDLALSSLTSSATNEVFEVGFGGLITLTASFVFLGLAGTTAAVGTGSFGLGFTTLPVVFAHMGALGNLIGAMWFFMLFLAAITSSISMYQPALAFFQESLGLHRRQATGLVCAVCMVGSFLVMYFSQGGRFWTTLDDWVGTFLIFILAGVQIICFSWVFGIDRGWQELHRGSRLQLPNIFRFVMKWISPLYLVIVFAFFCKDNLRDWVAAVASDRVRQGAIGLVLAVALLLVVCVYVGERRWRSQGLDIDNRRPSG